MNTNSEEVPRRKLIELYNSPDEESAIKVLCRRLLTSLHLQFTPVPLRPICQRLKLKVRYTNADNSEDSILKLTPQGFAIDISRQKNWRRNRFTIAHEIIHLLLYNVVGMPLRSYDKIEYEQVERLCDIGAAELLINEDLLSKVLNQYGLDSEGIRRVYDEFLVSYDTLFLKIASFLSANIILWKQYARHNNEEKAFRVFNHFPKYKYADKSTWLLTGCTVKHIEPNILSSQLSSGVSIHEDFKVLMNKQKTSCYVFSFPFPQARGNAQGLPIFEELVVKDETMYDASVVMIVFTDREHFAHAVSKFVKP